MSLSREVEAGVDPEALKAATEAALEKVREAEAVFAGSPKGLDDIRTLYAVVDKYTKVNLEERQALPFDPSDLAIAERVKLAHEEYGKQGIRCGELKSMFLKATRVEQTVSDFTEIPAEAVRVVIDGVCFWKGRHGMNALAQRLGSEMGAFSPSDLQASNQCGFGFPPGGGEKKDRIMAYINELRERGSGTVTFVFPPTEECDF